MAAAEATTATSESILEAAQQHVQAQLRGNYEFLKEKYGQIRPASPAIWNGSQDLNLCVYEMDAISMQSQPGFDPCAGRGLPVVRFFGTTKEGFNVSVLVRGFMPYIYVQPAASFASRIKLPSDLHQRMMNCGRNAAGLAELERKIDTDPALERIIANDVANMALCRNFQLALCKQMGDVLKLKASQNNPNYNPSKPWDDTNRYVDAINMVYKVELVRRQSVQGRYPHLSWMLKVTFGNPALVVTARDILMKTPFNWSVNPLVYPAVGETHKVFEANVSYPLRYMIDQGIFGSSWITLPKGKYHRWNQGTVGNTQNEVEVIIRHQDVRSHPVDDPQWSDHAPLRRFTFDIECLGRRGKFPDAEKDPVACISGRLSKEPDPTPDGGKRVVGDILFCWGKTPPIEGVDVCCFYQERNTPHPLNDEEASFPRLVNPILDADGKETGRYMVASVEDERNMLRAFHVFITKIANPNIISGHNISGFDIPYLIDRAKAVGLGDSFAILGMSTTDKTRIKETIFSSKAFGSRNINEFKISGRLVLDTYLIVTRDYKFRSYGLNFLANEWLGESKADLAHQQITPFWTQGEATRERVAFYCMKDTDLTDRLMVYKAMVVDKTEMARAFGVPLSYIFTRGQGVRAATLLMSVIKSDRLVVPFFEQEMSIDCDAEKYKGATVLEPHTGFYQDPVSTEDFQSLYPSIMQTYNLCLTTLVTEAQARAIGLRHVHIIPLEDGDVAYFLRATHTMGKLPKILERLTEKRNIAKKLMAATIDPVTDKSKDPGKTQILNARQNALKTGANSVYGITGARFGVLSQPFIARATTAIGRESIDRCVLVVENPLAEYPRLPSEYTDETFTPAEVAAADAAYAKRCQEARAAYPIPREPNETPEQHAKRVKSIVKVIYGDTDSIMILQRGYTLAAALDLGKAYSVWITKYFEWGAKKLVFEKVYYPFILIGKKKYSGMLYERADKVKKRDAKGLESVRRDSCKLVSNIIDQMFDCLLKTRDVGKMFDIVLKAIYSIRMGTMDMSELVMSKSLSHKPEDYDKPRPAHAQLGMRMAKRNPDTAPHMGDRVPYFMVKRAGAVKSSEKAEDPEYVLEHNMPLDIDYYIDNQLRLPVQRVLEPLIPGITQRLFAHSRSVLYIPKTLQQARQSVSEAAAAGAPLPAPTVHAVPKLKAPKRPKKSDPLPGQTTLMGALLAPPSKKRSAEEIEVAVHTESQIKNARRDKKAVGAGQMSLATHQVFTPAAMDTSGSSDSLPPPSSSVMEVRMGQLLVAPKHNFDKEAPDTIRVETVGSVRLATASASEANGIGRYIVVQKVCLCCRQVVQVDTPAPPPPEEEQAEKDQDAPERVTPAFCDSCMQNPSKRQTIRDAKHYWETLLKTHIATNNNIWKACLSCQNVATVEQLPTCRSITCPIFFRRTQMKRCVDTVKKTYERISIQIEYDFVEQPKRTRRETPQAELM